MDPKTTKFSHRRTVVTAILSEKAGVAITGENGTYTLPPGKAVVISTYTTGATDGPDYFLRIVDAESFVATMDPMPDSTPMTAPREEIAPF